MKRWICFMLALALCVCLSGCGAKNTNAKANSLSFSDAVSLDKIQGMDGQQVTIVGYMATLSPVSGKYMYLMNMPYQSCPFCVPNTTQLSNTMAVYAPEGKTFGFTDQAIRITGTMKVEDYTDEYGYSYNYRIVDASYETVDLSTVSDEYRLWQAIATDGVVGEINSMFDYLYFICQWTEYQGSYIDENGETVSYYLYPGDVSNILIDDGPYGYARETAEDYFPKLISRIRAISADGLEDLVAIVEQAQALSAQAIAALNSGEYSYDEQTDKYTLNAADEQYQAFYDVFGPFSEWLAKWEL